jgi:anthranilate/para-aminobenzoate synthase component II
MAKLVQRLKNVKVQTVISPGPGVPEIAARKRNRGKNQTEESKK